MSLKELQTELLAAQTEWEALVVFLGRGKYDFSQPRPSLGDQTFTVLSRRTRLAFEVLLGLLPDNESDEVAIVVVGSSLRNIRNTVLEYFGQVQAVTAQLRQSWHDNTIIAMADNDFSWYLTDEGVRYTNFDLSSNFKRIDELVNGLLAMTSSMLPLSKAEGTSDLLKRAEAIGLLIREVEAFRAQAQSFATAAQENAERAAASEKKVRDVETETDTIITTLRALQTQANADIGTVTSLVEQIKTTGTNAATLENVISDYQSKFDAFQKQLDDRNLEFKKFQHEKIETEKVLKDRGAEIARLTDLADFMISGATTAGLAKSMEDARARYEIRLNSARRGFYVAVVLLVLSSIPLAAQLLPGLFGSWVLGVDASASSNPYVVIGKIMLLLPATWCTAFFTKSYADLFHLEREYAHKAALAMSVDGFKRQAPRYEEEITAEVFMEIRTSPSKGQPVEAATHPLYDVLSKAVTKILDKKAEDKTKE
ncbi:hypothetical protein SB725_17285 [Pseudomonas sp. SIMBA_041]|uniref:hypothetical protein n=1 Tax=Pseudomonas sp. SIMBA_041 TaxID=3085782 RepID=UPI00397AD39F